MAVHDAALPRACPASEIGAEGDELDYRADRTTCSTCGQPCDERIIQPYSAQDTAATGIAARVTVAAWLIEPFILESERAAKAHRLLVRLRDILPPSSKTEQREARKL